MRKTAKLISAFIFATRIVQSLYYLNPKFQASSHLLWLYSPVCVGPGRKPRRPVFSQRGSHLKHFFVQTLFKGNYSKVEGVQYFGKSRYPSYDGTFEIRCSLCLASEHQPTINSQAQTSTCTHAVIYALSM